ncbi:MAG: hypothetical protein Q8933_09535 [Bacteroidota bacterium]|nr:hypothetical protein [Bacteroidota bacterium]MDP4190487.1 hypothetical protein [Bacteroidota bacterium]MDP4194779.1 hypothetical protein [Bacteroidota bacterium]
MNTSRTSTLIDTLMPEYDFNEVHSIEINASAESVLIAIKELKANELSWIFHLLIAMRELPEKLFGNDFINKSFFDGQQSMLEKMNAGGFIKLGEITNREIVLGLLIPETIGKFWKRAPKVNLGSKKYQDFISFNSPDFAKVTLNFLIDRKEKTILRTETRILPLSPKMYNSFKIYWSIIHIGSAWIRRIWLKAIKRHAERIEPTS